MKFGMQLQKSVKNFNRISLSYKPSTFVVSILTNQKFD